MKNIIETKIGRFEIVRLIDCDCEELSGLAVATDVCDNNNYYTFDIKCTDEEIKEELNKMYDYEQV